MEQRRRWLLHRIAPIKHRFQVRLGGGKVSYAIHCCPEGLDSRMPPWLLRLLGPFEVFGDLLGG
jgi:hypothetical protein